MRPEDLPDYTAPPIDEVVFGVHFKRIEGFTDAHSGLVWARLRERYPRSQSQPRVEAPALTLDRPAQPRPQPPFELVMANGLSNRTWLINAEDDRLLQIQDSAFLSNWRRRAGDYPHLEAPAEGFWEGFEAFRQVLTEEQLEQPDLIQLELSYFNWIPSEPGPAIFAPTAGLEVAVEDLTWDTGQMGFIVAYIDRPGGASPVGRLNVECVPSFRIPAEGEGTYGFRFSLTYRAPVSGAPVKSRIDELVARGRRAIVRTFTELTTDAAHAKWGRIR